MQVPAFYRVCNHCGLDSREAGLPLFEADAGALGGLRNRCTPCGKARAAAGVTRNRRRLRAIILWAKRQPCMDCGQRFHYAAMEFDHVLGDKRGAVSRAVTRGWSVETLRAEMAKCELVCANCHRVRTWQRMR